VYTGTPAEVNRKFSKSPQTQQRRGKKFFCGGLTRGFLRGYARMIRKRVKVPPIGDVLPVYNDMVEDWKAGSARRAEPAILLGLTR